MGDKGSNMQDVWAATDKPMIDRMKAQTFRATAMRNHGHFTSSEDSSDSDSETNSEASFLAVPREFRPNLTLKQSPLVKKKLAETPALIQQITCPLIPSISTISPRYNLNAEVSSSTNLIKHLPSKSNTFNKVDSTKESYDRSITLRKIIKGKEQTPLNLLLTNHSDNEVPQRPNVLLKEHGNGLYRTKCLPSKQDVFLKENSTLNKTNSAEKRLSQKCGVTMEVVMPRNDKESLQIFSKTGISRNYFKDKEQIKTNSPLTHHPRGMNSEIYKKSKEKIIDFECVNVSEQAKISKTKTIEFDVAKLTLDVKTSRTITDSSKFQMLPDNKKKTFPKRKKNNCNYSNRNNYSSTKELVNVSPENGFVKWHDTTNSKRSSPDFLISKTENETETFSKTSDKTVEWTITREKKIFYSVTGLSSDETRKPRKLFDVKDINSSQTFSEDIQPLKWNIHVQNMDKAQDTQNNVMPETCMKQPREYGTWEETDYLEHYSAKNNLNKNNYLQTNKNVTKNAETKYQNKRDDYNQTTYPENTPYQINYTGGCFSKTPKLLHQINKLNPRSQCDQLVNFSTENLSYEVPLSKKTLSNVTVENFKPSQGQNLLIQFGKEISDLIIGSHTALSTLFSIYGEWKQLRFELIDQFKQLAKAINESSKRYRMYQDMVEVGNGIAMVATNIPNPYVGMAARIVTILTSLASKVLKTSNTNKIDVDEPEITRLLLKDIDNSSELYMHGLQCNMQFEETVKEIEKFHSNAMLPEFTDIDCPDLLKFVRGVLEYRPQHRIFYKKLHKCFQELLQNGTSENSMQFCEPFLLYATNAVDVVGHLNWHFIEVDNVSVKHELKDILSLIQNSSMENLASRINNCIRLLSDELESVTRCITKVPIFEISE